MKPKYQLDTEENKLFMKEIRDDLLNFGHKFPSPDGSSYYLGDDGTPWTDRSRETWITCRMTHVYSIGTLLGHGGSEALADLGLKGVTDKLHDKEHDGWYAGVTADDEVLPNKQCYAHAFVILAATSALLAGRPGARELLENALAVYDKFFWNEKEGLACDTWNTEFSVLDDYRGLNANMHTVEAFLAVADAAGMDMYRIRAGRIIDHVIAWASENDWRIPEHFTKQWHADLECNKDHPDDPFKPYGATPGHGIEWARLITQWALSTYKYNAAAKGDSSNADSAADKYIAAAENLYCRAIADAWNVDGAPGIVYTTDWEGKPVVHDRMHWTLAEAINTSAVLAHVTGKARYAEDYAQFLQYLDEIVLDHVNGSWFHQLDQNNHVMGTVWPGKSDIYHALQATLIPYSDPAVSIAKAVATASSSV
ncbi:MAG: AGE family epimerase/isomerase [Hespellia sp.]|nr:AGE family epimerase/isomerase [Hespellia sp.]